jgi:hypothetical protein
MYGHQLKIPLIKPNGDPPENSYNIAEIWKKYFSELLNVHTANEYRQPTIHSVKLSVPLAKFQ